MPITKATETFTAPFRPPVRRREVCWSQMASTRQHNKSLVSGARDAFSLCSDKWLVELELQRTQCQADTVPLSCSSQALQVLSLRPWNPANPPPPPHTGCWLSRIGSPPVVLGLSRSVVLCPIIFYIAWVRQCIHRGRRVGYGRQVGSPPPPPHPYF